LAGILAPERSRASLLAAIRARRTFATTGARIGLRVEVDGAPMGSELPADTRGTLTVEVIGTAPIARVTVVGTEGETVLDTDRGAAVRAQLAVGPDPQRPWTYRYVRVLQCDGEMAWSSPIWIG